MITPRTIRPLLRPVTAAGSVRTWIPHAPAMTRLLQTTPSGPTPSQPLSDSHPGFKSHTFIPHTFQPSPLSSPGSVSESVVPDRNRKPAAPSAELEYPARLQPTKPGPAPSPATPATANAPETNSGSTAAPAAPKARKSRLRPVKAVITLRPAAVDKLRELLDQPNPQMIRVGVKNRGCSGLAYHLEYVEGPKQFDEVVEQDGVKVLVDSKALFSIIGSEMDWHEDRLMQKFVFKNPNISDECGCGESFSVS